jgi:hypothetical protein
VAPSGTIVKVDVAEWCVAITVAICARLHGRAPCHTVSVVALHTTTVLIMHCNLSEIAHCASGDVAEHHCADALRQECNSTLCQLWRYKKQTNKQTIVPYVLPDWTTDEHVVALIVPTACTHSSIPPDAMALKTSGVVDWVSALWNRVDSTTSWVNCVCTRGDIN